MRVFYLLFLLLFYTKGIAHKGFIFENFNAKNGLPGGQVYQTIQDKEGFLWFATDRGVSRYDGHRFIYFGPDDGLTDEVVFGFFLGNDGRLWFNTYHGGLCYYEKGTISEPAFNKHLKAFIKEHVDIVIVSFFVDEEENAWIGFNNGTLLKVNAKGEITFRLAEYDPSLKRNFLLIKTESRENPNWICSRREPYNLPDTIAILSLADSSLSFIPVELKKESHIRFSSRSVFYQIDDQSFLFAFGTNLLKVRNGKVIQHRKLPYDKEILYALLIDQKGDLWVGTRKGVYCFKHADLSRTPLLYLESQQISSVYQDHEGGFWFTSLNNNGVFYQPNFEVHSLPNHMMGENNLKHLCAGSYGVYGGSIEDNLLIFPHGNFDELIIIKDANYDHSDIVSWHGKEVISRTTPQLLAFSDSVPHVVDFKYAYAKRNDYNIPFVWIHTSDAFQLISTRDTSVVKELNMDCITQRVRYATASKDGNLIWIGHSQGLWMYEREKLSKMGNTFPELETSITDLDLVDDQYLLITTRGKGVFRYNYRLQKLKKLHGILNAYCDQTYIDSKKQAWVTSFSGVTRITAIASDDPCYAHFTTQNGLISNVVHNVTEFNGHIWAATAEGISRWSMDWTPPGSEPKTSLAAVSINGKKHDPGSVSKLDHKENYLDFFFNSISFQRPVTFQYRLRGLHLNWINTTDRHAAYVSLEPGHYVFELKHQGEEKIRSAIAFTISPPLWLTPWFLISVTLLLVGSTLYVLRLRYRIIRRENKLYELFVRSEQKALRAQINPHFLFNSFNSILELLANKEYEAVQPYMKNLSRLMRMVLRHSREEEVSLLQEIELLQTYLEIEKLRFGKQLSFELEVEPGLPVDVVYLPALFLQPYVENALKHGIRSRQDEQGRLHISFRREENGLIVRIEDNGKGYAHSIRNNRLSKKRSYGTKINGERIQLFKTKAHFDIHISPSNPADPIYPGTIIYIQMPLKIKHPYVPTTL